MPIPKYIFFEGVINQQTSTRLVQVIEHLEIPAGTERIGIVYVN